MSEHDNTGPRLGKAGQGFLPVGEFGTLWLVWSERGLRRLDWERPNGSPGEATEVPRCFAEPLERYFRGEPVDPALLPVDLEGTEFQRRVWSALRRVPRGQVRSYAGIAADVGSPRAMRAVGMANRHNPLAIVVPCHRIVQAGHQLGGYSGGLDRKRFLLALEGVRVEQDRVLPGQLDLWASISGVPESGCVT